MKSGKLIIVLAVVIVLSTFFSVPAFAQQAAPPVFGCLGLGGQQCSFIQVAPPQTSLMVNGKPLRGNKRVVHYGDTVTGSISYINTGNLPLSISKVGVAAKKGNYEVFFTPSQGQIILEPGQRVNIPQTSHKFNYPDPPGDWTVAGRVTNTDNQSVDGNNPDLFTVVADCTPLRSNEQGVEADADKLNQYCQGKTNDALCQEFCEFKPDLAKNCAEQKPGDGGQDPNAPQPDQQQPDQQQPDQQQPDQQQPDQQNPGQNPGGGQDPNAPQPDQQNPNQPDQGQQPNPNPDQNQQPEAPNNNNQNPLQQIQEEFQKFLDDLRELLGIKN